MTRVLHVNHTAVVGGAERSLLALLDHTDRRRIAGVCCPPGPLAREVLRRELPWFATREPEARFDASPAERLAAAGRLARTGPTVDLVSRRVRADVVHANSVRTALAVSLSSTRLVAHVRDVLPPGATARTVKRAVVARSDRVVAISRFVAQRFGEDIERRGRWAVVDNPIDLRRFPITTPADRPAARRTRGLAPDRPLALVIGQVTPWKRQLLAIEAVAAARRLGVDAQLAVVGSVKFTEGRTGETNREYEQRLHERVAELGLAEVVTFLGESDDVGGMLAAADVVLVPSEDEPFGRVAAEAIASRVPVLASAVGGPADIIERFGGGIVASRDESDSWAVELVRLLEDRGVDGVLGDAAEAVRRTFDASVHARAMASLFDDVAR
jgi:glycosyltransferase involved in cell wall biosynthesis